MISLPRSLGHFSGLAISLACMLSPIGGRDLSPGMSASLDSFFLSRKDSLEDSSNPSVFCFFFLLLRWIDGWISLSLRSLPLCILHPRAWVSHALYIPTCFAPPSLSLWLPSAKGRYREVADDTDTHSDPAPDTHSLTDPDR